MSKITPCLWFDGTAEEAANFYASLLPDSHVEAVHRAPSDYPSGKAGDVLTVEFTLMGQPFMGLNGGPLFKFNEAVSFQIPVETQAEVDRRWPRQIRLNPFMITANRRARGPASGVVTVTIAEAQSSQTGAGKLRAMQVFGSTEIPESKSV